MTKHNDPIPHEADVTCNHEIEYVFELTGYVRDTKTGEDVKVDGLTGHMNTPADVVKVAVPGYLAERLRDEMSKHNADMVDVFFRKMAHAGRKLADPDFAELPPEYLEDID